MSGQICGSKADVNAARQVVNGSDWAALPNQESRNKTTITAVKATATTTKVHCVFQKCPLTWMKRISVKRELVNNRKVES